MYDDFWHDYVKPKFGGKVKLCFMAANSLFVYIKTGDTYKDIAEDIDTRLDTLNFELERPLIKAKNNKVIGLNFLD